MKLTRLLGGLAAACILTLPVMADEIYTYTGNDFTSFSGGSTYTTGDSVSGFFELTTALGNNLAFGAISPTDYSFTDDQQVLSGPPPTATFEVATNNSGAITEWFISIPNGSNSITTSNEPGNVIDDGVFNGNVGDTTNSPGSFTASVAGVPEPGSLMLVGAGLLALGTVRLRFGRRKA